jgi:hypothetical protein
VTAPRLVKSFVKSWRERVDVFLRTVDGVELIEVRVIRTVGKRATPTDRAIMVRADLAGDLADAVRLAGTQARSERSISTGGDR